VDGYSGACGNHKRETYEYKIVNGKPKGKRLRRRFSCRWEGKKIKMNYKKVQCRGMEWIHLAQDKVQWLNLVNKVINLLWVQ
jgi:hypothetical protein